MSKSESRARFRLLPDSHRFYKDLDPEECYELFDWQGDNAEMILNVRQQQVPVVKEFFECCGPIYRNPIQVIEDRLPRKETSEERIPSKPIRKK